MVNASRRQPAGDQPFHSLPGGRVLSGSVVEAPGARACPRKTGSERPRSRGNGTLGQLQITDTYHTGNAQTCAFGYDDLSRLTTDQCGSAWQQTFGYDAFGNIEKTGSSTFLVVMRGPIVGQIAVTDRPADD